MFRLTRLNILRVQPTTTRLISTTPVPRKSVIDTAKDAVKTVDRTISNAAVKGIDVGTEAAETAKKTLSQKTDEASSEASAKMSEASGKVQELNGEAKGKTAELKGLAKEKAGEVKSNM